MSENDVDSIAREGNMESKCADPNNYGMYQTYPHMNKKQSMQSTLSRERSNSPNKTSKFRSLEGGQSSKSKRNGGKPEKRGIVKNEKELMITNIKINNKINK